MPKEKIDIMGITPDAIKQAGKDYRNGKITDKQYTHILYQEYYGTYESPTKSNESNKIKD